MIEKLKELICEAFEKTELIDHLTEKTNVIEDLGVDSIQLINLMLKIEEEFDIEIDFDNFDISHFDSIGSLSSFVSRMQEAV